MPPRLWSGDPRLAREDANDGRRDEDSTSPLFGLFEQSELTKPTERVHRALMRDSVTMSHLAGQENRSTDELPGQAFC